VLAPRISGAARGDLFDIRCVIKFEEPAGVLRVLELLANLAELSIGLRQVAVDPSAGVSKGLSLKAFANTAKL